ncbi:XRE family transcriptional regulator [Shewanella xiamenensis]|uniref:Helix-turn-helix transcriptional regulator n=1 Tax=Shewanella xiamenensis TaxID=332186 RepID=A0AAE4Q0Z7_9GAMM|nr:helix-turn-helix transcriptional regulator [Shewanella xiamenensis]MDV5390769.1 helix-turn-helix transcriptional regulator [Shewanella xiamenensis]
MNYDDPKKKVGRNIKRLRLKAGIKSQAALAELCGWKSQSRVGNYEAGTRAVSAIDAEILAKVLNVTPAEILYGENNKDDDFVSTPTVQYSSQPYEEERPVIFPIPLESNAEWHAGFELWDGDTPLRDDEVALPFYREVELAAGSGSTFVQENGGCKLRFAKSTLKKSRVEPQNAACVTVSGNSMLPVLRHGTTVGVDTSKKSIIDGEMYAIDHDGMLRVKMLYRTPGGGIRIKSYNNDEFPDEFIPPEKTSEIKIIGWVFWWSVLNVWNN